MKKLLFISLFLMAAAPTMAQNPSDNAIEDKFVPPMIRSEERRVGKECRL